MPSTDIAYIRAPRRQSKSSGAEYGALPITAAVPTLVCSLVKASP